MSGETAMDTPSTATHDDLSDRVLKLAAAQVATPAEQISLDARFTDDLGFDSLDFIEFTMEIEDRFGVSVPDDVAQRIVTVRQAVQEIRRLSAAQDRTE